MKTIILEIRENNGDIYRITQTGKYRFITEAPGSTHTGGKSYLGFMYQILVDMAKMEPERFTITADSGSALGFQHMSVFTMEGILRLFPMFYDGNEQSRIERCENEIIRLQKITEYDQEHEIKTGYYTGWDSSGDDRIKLFKSGDLYQQHPWRKEINA